MPKKILIIDPSEEDKINIQEKLLGAKIDCEFTVAGTGEEGLEKFKSTRPDIVIIETQLPDADGAEICKKIKDIKDVDAKVILQTGTIDLVDAGKARKAEADDYCVKTSGCEPLIDAVKKLL